MMRVPRNDALYYSLDKQKATLHQRHYPLIGMSAQICSGSIPWHKHNVCQKFSHLYMITIAMFHKRLTAQYNEHIASAHLLGR